MKLHLTLKQCVLLTTTAMIVPLALCQIYGVAVMRQSPAFDNPAMPQVADLSIAVVMAVAFVSLRLILTRAFHPLARAVLRSGKRESAFRVDRFATSVFKFLHFSVLTYIGFRLLADKKWFPPSLGGSGDVLEPLETIHVPPSAALRLYMLVEFGYQLHSFVFVLLLKPVDSDTMDFVAHDLLAMQLIGASYLTNYVNAGALVAFINDGCDVVQYGFFMATDSGRKAIVAPLLVAIIASWTYLRLYVFPRDCLYNYMVAMAPANPFMSMLFLHPLNAMIMVLVGLHAYWLVLFIKKGVHVLCKARPSSAQACKKI